MSERFLLKDRTGRELGPRQFEWDDFDREVKLSPGAQRTEDELLANLQQIVDKRRGGGTKDAFVETEHPRGQPKNAGEFATKGQQSAKSQTEGTAPKDTPATSSSSPARPTTQTSAQRVEQVGKEPFAKGAPPQGADFVKLVKAQHPGDHPGMISPRRITVVKHVFQPGEYNEPTLEAMMKMPKQFHQIVNLIKKYPALRINDAVGHPDEVAKTFIKQAKDNILFLYDNQNPTIRERSKAWYFGARHIVDAWSKKYNLPDTAIAGALASLSPQADWTRNVSMVERVLDIYKGTETKPAPAKSFRFSPEMAETVKTICKSSAPNRAFWKPATVQYFMNKRCDELADDVEKGWWVRLYDQTYNDKSYREVTPEGGFSDFVKVAGDKNGTLAWMNTANIGKAIHCIDNPDAASIDDTISDANKVRSFYNNILAPSSTKGSVTIDTHAVAAALLRALSGDDLEVYHNFGNGKPPEHDDPKDHAKITKRYENTPKMGLTGSKGTYPLYAEAYRQAAFERGVLPNEMQSIAWEAARGLFSPEFKAFKRDGDVEQAWADYKAGKASINDTRQRVLKAAGGIQAPPWVGAGVGNDAAGGGSSYAGRLPGRVGG